MKKIFDKVYKITADCNVYFLDLDKKIVIDTSSSNYRDLIKKELNCDKIDIVIFTHLHYDHIGNWDLFKNAKFYASDSEIDFFNKVRLGTVLDAKTLKNFKAKLNRLSTLNLSYFEIINTPGHTVGSVCLLYKNVLFSGDTLFDSCSGRVDLPSSRPLEMKKSLDLLKKVKSSILCCGHDY